MVDDVLLRFGLNAVAISVLAFGMYDRRHGRRELAVTLGLVNVAVFVAVVVITAGQIGLSVGIGLFALLSMVRLRSETFSSTELAYVLVAIALAVALAVGREALGPLLAGLALLAVGLLDHPRVHTPSRLMQVTLELVFADHDALRRHLEERLNVDVLDVRVVEIDYVRETTRVELRCSERPSGPPLAVGQIGSSDVAAGH